VGRCATVARIAGFALRSTPPTLRGKLRSAARYRRRHGAV
jgi:hypothetical protein